MDKREELMDDVEKQSQKYKKDRFDYSIMSFASLAFMFAFIAESIFISSIISPLIFINYIHYLVFYKKATYKDKIINRLNEEKKFLEDDNNYSVFCIEEEENKKIEKLQRDKADFLGNQISSRNKALIRFFIALGSSIFISKSFIFLIISIVSSLSYAFVVEEEIDIREKIENINKSINTIEYGLEINAEDDIINMISI